MVKAYFPKTMYFIPYIGIWFSVHLKPVFIGIYKMRGANDNAK